MVNDTKIGRYTYPKIKIFNWHGNPTITNYKTMTY